MNKIKIKWSNHWKIKLNQKIKINRFKIMNLNNFITLKIIKIKIKFMILKIFKIIIYFKNLIKYHSFKIK